jgi:cell division septation protein DedD
MRGIGEAESNFSQDFYNRECHIIGIGIDKYKYKDWPILSNCEKDVERFIGTVCSSFKTFKDSTNSVTRLYNEDANKLLIGDTIKGKLRELRSHQNLIIYFAGHGKDHEKEDVSYLAPYDAKPDYVNPDNSRLISFQDIFKWIADTNALHIVLILDCCHAGRIMNAKRSSPDRFEKIVNFEDYINLNIGYADFQSQMKEKSIWVITSGSDNDKVSDGDILGSPFSQALNKVLTGSFKFNKPLSVAYLGSVLKNHFPAKHKYKPDFKRLSDILDYKSNKGEFVFEPKPLKEIHSENTTDESSKESSKKTNEPSNTEGPSIGETFFNKIPLYQQAPSTQTNYSNTESKPTKSRFKYWASLILIAIPLLFLYKTKRDKNKDKPDPTIEITTVIPPSATLDGGIHTWRPPVEKTTASEPVIATETTKSTTPNDSTTIPKDEEKDGNSGNLPKTKDGGSNETTTSIGDDVGAKSSVGSKSAIQKDKNGNPIRPNDYNVIDKGKPYNENNTLTENPNLVFVGSFENKANAEGILERLRKIGYKDAEIIMKENMPYAVVVTGFYQHKSSAISEVKAIRKRGFEVYYAKADLTKIYRQKE